jgi:monoamine oxidase
VTERVAIVGAGLAGLSAARELARHDIEVVILEARDRIGGRAHTLHDPGGDLPVELGPEYVHGLPDVTVGLARAAGLTRNARERELLLARARAPAQAS